MSDDVRRVKEPTYVPQMCGCWAWEMAPIDGTHALLPWQDYEAMLEENERLRDALKQITLPEATWTRSDIDFIARRALGVDDG